MTIKAYTIAEFCTAYRLPRSTYYELRHEGRGPVTYKIGARIFISKAAAEQWAREQEATPETGTATDATARKPMTGRRPGTATKTAREAPPAGRGKTKVVVVPGKPAAPKPTSRRIGLVGKRTAGTAEGRRSAKTPPKRQPQRR